MNWTSAKHPGLGRMLLLSAIGLTSLTYAGHGDVSLPGSDFEIDTDANLVADHVVPAFDWTDLDLSPFPAGDIVFSDTASGPGDDSFGKGTKEDISPPSVVSGSIPPNKSDLKEFGVYLEDRGLGRFLHLFWTRAQDPSGTTNMDFEFNQSGVISANGVTPVRTNADLLIVYELSKGGTDPQLFLFKWIDGTDGETAADCEATNSLPCWKTREDLTGIATGSINSTAIAAGNSGGLGALSARTFGEASVAFSSLIPVGGECVSFGSAYLKSRSSDSFTSALKDFIAPQGVNVSNCASLKIIKEDELGNTIQGVTFDLFLESGDDAGAYNPGQDTATVYTCTTGADGSCTINNILADDYWIVEDATSVPSPFDPTSSPQAVTVSAGGTIQEFTFTNPIQRGTIQVAKVTDPDGSTQSFTFNPSWKGSFALQDNQAANVSTNLLPSAYDDGGGQVGNYSVSESAQSGWTLTSATCTDNIDNTNTDASAISLRPNETVTCIFTNTIQLGGIVVQKQTDPDGSTQQFTFNPNWKSSFMLADDGEDTSSNLLPSSEFGGDYSVSEANQDGWDLTSATCTDSIDNSNTDPAAITLRPGETVTCVFNNTIKRGTIVVEKETDPDGFAGSFQFNPSWKSSFNLSDDGSDSTSNLLPSSETGSDYSVSETVPGGWNLTSGVCVSSIDTGNTDPAAITLRPDETVTCTFTNAVQRGAILITKTRKHAAADTPSADPHQSVEFTTSGGSLNSADVQNTDVDGQICVGNLILSSLPGIGDYSVTETLPSGYVADGLLTKTVTVTDESSCGDGNEATVSFGNTPLTDIYVAVDSQVGGGTHSTIACELQGGSSIGSNTAPDQDDLSLDVDDLQPGTYVCTIVIDP